MNKLVESKALVDTMEVKSADWFGCVLVISFGVAKVFSKAVT